MRPHFEKVVRRRSWDSNVPSLVIRPDRINFPGLALHRKILQWNCVRCPYLRRAGFGEVGEDTVAITGQKSAAITVPARSGRRKRVRDVDNIFARRPSSPARRRG